MAMTVGAVEDFLMGKAGKVQQRARTLGKIEEQELTSRSVGEEQGKIQNDSEDGVAGRKIGKVGDQGELVFHPVEGDVNSVGTTV